MAITEQEFSSLKKDDVMIDAEGESWIVHSDAKRDGSSIRAWVKDMYLGNIVELRWMNLGEGGVGIMDEEIALVMVLNHAEAHIQ